MGTYFGNLGGNLGENQEDLIVVVIRPIAPGQTEPHCSLAPGVSFLRGCLCGQGECDCNKGLEAWQTRRMGGER